MIYKVFKYPLANSIDLPKGSVVLSAVSKSDGCFIYAQVPQGVEETERHRFCILPTGMEFHADEMKYIGTVIEVDYFAWHIYELLQDIGGCSTNDGQES